MKLLDQNGNELRESEPIDLGEAEVGTTKDFIFYIFNDTTGDILNIKVDIIDTEQKEDLLLKNVPSKVSPNQKVPFIVSWSPTLKVQKRLDMTLKISVKTLWK